jgi:hypothetical protein
MAPTTCTWRTWLVTTRLGSRTFNKEIVDLFEECKDCAWLCAEWSGTSRIRRPSCSKSITRSAMSRSVIMWSRLALTMTCAFQATCAWTSRHYSASGHYTSTSFMRSRRCVTPMSCQTSVGSLWLRSKPSFDQFVPCHSQHRLTHGSSLALAGPMSSKPRLLPSRWLIRLSTSCRHLVLGSSQMRMAVVVMANGMAKHSGTTCPRWRSKLNN